MSTSMKKVKAAKAPVKPAGRTASKVAARPVATKGAAKSRSRKDVGEVVPAPRTVAKKAAAKTRQPEPSAQTKLKLVPATTTRNTGANAAPKAHPPKPVQNKLRIFQIYYRPEQRQFLDPAFEPYNNEGDDNPLLEFNVFRKLSQSQLVKGAELWGALSWKFGEKTGLTGEQLRQTIAANPGYDVYYCNPFPEMEGLYHNFWLQGETSHPNFLLLSREFFAAAGLDEGLITELVPSQRFAASNYFVATPRFWAGYLQFVEDAIVKAEAGMSSTARAMMYSSAADRKGLHAGASYLPFIVERLFDVYLHRSPGKYRQFKITLEFKEARLNVHARLLRQMKDVALHSKSLWLASCWINYRNLYLSQNYGNEWCRQYIRAITPLEFAL